MAPHSPRSSRCGSNPRKRGDGRANPRGPGSPGASPFILPCRADARLGSTNPQEETIAAMTETMLRPPRRPRWAIAALAVVLFVIVVLGGYWLFTQGPGRQVLSPPGSTVAQFSGASDQTTQSFQVREGWAINWDSTGQRFAFAIRGDRDFGTVINITEPGSGVTSPTGAGSFHLEVTAQGSWTISITQGG
jgi:hypothetical protein